METREGSHARTVAEVGKDVRREAWEVFLRYADADADRDKDKDKNKDKDKDKNKDKEWIFTGCSNFIVMPRLGLTEAFTFDEHFRQMGYVVQPW